MSTTKATPPLTLKKPLGDGSHVAFRWPGFVVTTADKDTVFLEPDALVELVKFAAPIVSPGIRRRIAEAVK